MKQKKIIFILIFVFILIFFINNKSFASNEGIALLGLEDNMGMQAIFEDIIIEQTGYTLSNFDDTKYSYFVFYDDKEYLYHVLTCYDSRMSGFDSSYSVWFVNNNSDLALISRKRITSTYVLKYFTVNEENFNDISTVTEKTYEYGSDLTIIFNDLFNTTILNYSNMLFASNSVMTYMNTYCNREFTNRLNVYEPCTEVLDENMSGIEFYDIAPRDYYCYCAVGTGGKLVESCQSFELRIWRGTPHDDIEDEIVNTYTLNLSSPYWFSDDLIFHIPISSIKLYLGSTGNYYTDIHLTTTGYSVVQNTFTYDADTDIIGSITTPDEGGEGSGDVDSNTTLNDSIKEQTEVNKGIWETVKSIVNFLNPLSEDFFVYKLIELLLDMLKSLFVPADDFFTNWFDDLNEWLGDRFGILYFPFEIVLEFLNRVGGLAESSSYTLNIPSFEFSFLGYSATLINGFTYDFNSLLANDTFKNIHDIYLVVVDVILYIWLVYLCYNTFVDVFGGKYIETAANDVNSDIETHNIEKNKRKVGFDTTSKTSRIKGG